MERHSAWRVQLHHCNPCVSAAQDDTSEYPRRHVHQELNDHRNVFRRLWVQKSLQHRQSLSIRYSTLH